MIIHGILVDKDWNLLMRLLLDEPTIQPQSESKECWMDRRAYSPYQKRKMWR